MNKKLLIKSFFGLGALILPGCQNTNHNPTKGEFIKSEMKSTFETIKRVDKNGYVFSMNYKYDYYNEDLLNIVKNIKIDLGCSAFTMYNASNEYNFCRNYDYMHKDTNGNPTGCNLVILTSPKDKLKSINLSDLYFLNKEFVAASLDDGKTDISNVILSPFSCTDGINEAGVACGLFALDTKKEKGETAINQNTGKDKVMHSHLMRYILDNAHNVSEAVEIANKYDVFAMSGSDIHMMITDKDGNSAALEWRQYVEGGETSQTLHVTYTNAITNFFVGFDDAQDMYYADGTLREKFTKLETTWNTYHYGYGHGYHRFSGIVSALDRYTNDKSVVKNNVKQAQMTEEQAKNILSVAAQEPGFEKTSYTQYSNIYNLAKKSLTLYSQRDYSISYTFAL